MRIAVLIAASVLVGGCSQGVDGDAEQAEPSRSAPASTTRSMPRTTSPTPTTPAKPPAEGAPVADVIAFIEAGRTADIGQYHSATRDGRTTQLGEDVAFTTPSGTSSCMTDSKDFGGALACLVDLSDPPPPPADVYGEWKARLGRLRRADHRSWFGAWRSRPIHQRRRPRASLRRRAGLRRLPVPVRPRRLVLRQLRPPVGRPVQRRGRRAVRLPADGGTTSRNRREVQLLSVDVAAATPFWRSSGSTPSANQ